MCDAVDRGGAPVFRAAERADLPALAALAARTFPDACPARLPRRAVQDFVTGELSEHALSGHLDTPGHRLRLLCAADGDPVAYALVIDGTEMDRSCTDLVVHRPTAGISKFYLDGSVRGTGAAGRLLAELCREARDRGLESLWLATNVENLRARSFYVRSGFLERGGRTFVVGGVDNLDVVYELPLR